jgi:hypothetical protein
MTSRVIVSGLALSGVTRTANADEAQAKKQSPIKEEIASPIRALNDGRKII